MRVLKLALGLVSTAPTIPWSPNDESSLMAWWKKGIGVAYDGGYAISSWQDSSDVGGTAYELQQGTALEKPHYTATGTDKGTVTFDPDESQNFDIVPQMVIAESFTIGFRLNVVAVGGCLLADNDEVGEFMRLTGARELRVKLANGAAMNFELDTEEWGDGVLILTRDEAGDINLWWDGVRQVVYHNNGDEVRVDNLGVRKLDTNPFDGWIREVQIYDDENDILTEHIYESLKNL